MSDEETTDLDGMDDPIREVIHRNEAEIAKAGGPVTAPADRDPRKAFLRIVADKVLDKPDLGREDSYATIAQFWTTYLHGKGLMDGDDRLEDYDVALLMDLFKTARLTHDPHHEDSWVDKAGYTIGGYEKAVANYPRPQS